MSKRGKRRTSRRRKSSSSSKQSESTYTCQKQNRSNGVGCKDELPEKGEQDSLRKENVLSGSDKEKSFERQRHINPVAIKMSICTKTTEDGENRMKIETTVSIGDADQSCPKVTFHQSRETSSTPVTNVTEINCTGSHVKVEIQETVGADTPGTRTTVVVVNANGTETCLRDKYSTTWMPNDEFFEQPPYQGTGHSGDRNMSYSFSSGGAGEQTKAHSPTKSWENPGDCRCCCDHKRQTPDGFWLTNRTSSPPVRFNIQPQARTKLHRSFVSGQGWDVPPPREFADKHRCLEDLTRDLAFCRIGPADEQPLDASFDQLSESDNYEPMLMRGSLSTNRSSFTKDFINCQKRKSWIRNNSISTVEHRTCPFPKKRRQTFPGVSKGVGLMQDDLIVPFGESFSSLFVCSLHLGAEKLGKRLRGKEKLLALGIGNNTLSQTKEASKPSSETPGSQVRKQVSPFYITSSEDRIHDVLAVDQHHPQSGVAYYPTGLRQERNGLKQSASMEMESLDDCVCEADRGETADSGFDQEMGHGCHHSPELITEELRQRGLAIHFVPPSCSSSEEPVLQSRPVTRLHSNRLENVNKEDCVPVAPERTKFSVGSLTVGELEQRLETHMTASEDHCKAHPGELREDTEALRGTPGNSSPCAPGTADEACDDITEGSDKPTAEEQLAKPAVSSSSSETRWHLKPVLHKDSDSSSSDHWAKRRKLFREAKQWSSAGGSSVTSDITEESASEETRGDLTRRGSEDGGFYTETFHSSAWIYHGGDVGSGDVPSSINTGTRVVSIRERTVCVSRGTGEHPWGFRIQFSKPIVVMEVDTNGAAEEAGLMVGDFVLAVNGTDVTSISHCEAAALARKGPDVLTLTVGSDIARCPNTAWPACRGYLHKRTQSGLIKGWRKRWFVLTHDCCLYYYRHKRDEGKRRPLSAVRLEGATVAQDASLGKPFVFQCRPLLADRVYFFCATSSQEMKRWLEAMQRCARPVTQKHVWVDVTRHNRNLPPLAVKSPECLGLLLRAEPSSDSWVQCYCVLKDACLYLFSGIRATHAHGGIYLQGYTVREQPYGSKKSSIELKPPLDEFKTFYLCAENPSENKRWIVAIKASIGRWLPLHQALQDYTSRAPEETRM